jgi:hypothetical protein
MNMHNAARPNNPPRRKPARAKRAYGLSRYALAFAASIDTGNRAMRTAGRSAWSEDDYNASCAEFDRIYPIEQHLDDAWEAFCGAEARA